MTSKFGCQQILRSLDLTLKPPVMLPGSRHGTYWWQIQVAINRECEWLDSQKILHVDMEVS
jgi:hypothetical protein